MSLVIKLVRHGESEANIARVNSREVGDHAIALSERGWEQARQVGQKLGSAFLRDSLIYVSPYRRTRETLQGIFQGQGQGGGPQLEKPPRVFEDPRLREVDHGYEDIDEQLELRRLHGWFYYRFRSG